MSFVRSPSFPSAGLASAFQEKGKAVIEATFRMLPEEEYRSQGSGNKKNGY
jgi:hypothetical protein